MQLGKIEIATIIGAMTYRNQRRPIAAVFFCLEDRMANHVYSQRGFKLTRHFEGIRLTAYADQVGVWTIGYGHTGLGVHAGLTITQDQADAFLASDIAGAVACVNKLVTSEITQSQFDALVDFVFNLGCASLASSTLLRAVNTGDFDVAARQFQRWDHAGGVAVPGLLERRQAEAALFQSQGEN
jgi:lysozyme